MAKQRKTRFDTVPLAEVLEKVNGPLELPPDQEVIQRRRILVVDDERAIADTLALILRNAGYEVVVAYDAETGLLQYGACAPHLVISDVVMPGMDGIQMALRLRRRDPECRILLFSGQAVTSDLLKAARDAGHDFELLVKPIHPQELLAHIRQRIDLPA